MILDRNVHNQENENAVGCGQQPTPFSFISRLSATRSVMQEDGRRLDFGFTISVVQMSPCTGSNLAPYLALSACRV
jgi:hypothetical protein